MIERFIEKWISNDEKCLEIEWFCMSFTEAYYGGMDKCIRLLLEAGYETNEKSLFEGERDELGRFNKSQIWTK